MSDFEDMKVRRMRLDALNPAEYNPRKMRDQARQGLGSSIGKFGMLVPIVWNERTGNIVGGHQRYEHLVAVGEEETDVVVVDLDDDTEVALNLTLNSDKVRGDFTQDVVGLLEMSEAQLGDAFNELGLLDLHNFVKRLKFEDDDPPPPPDGDGTKDGDKGGDKDPPMPSGPNAVISCPRCRSRWRMSDNRVVHNAMGKPREDADERDPVED